MVMVGFGTNQTAKDSLLFDIQHRNLGGSLFLGYNVKNPSQIKSLNTELQSQAATPLFLAIDQEGGIVARLDESNGYKETYNHYQLGTEFDSEDSTRAVAALMAGWLNDAGFNMNLAPVVDVNVNPHSPAIGGKDRSFSNDEYNVYLHASWFMDEFHKLNIATSLKHYPGHGSALEDSHNGFTDITDTWEDRELDPFKFIIENGYSDAIMTGHLFNENWDTKYPASLSHYAITTILRDSLGFDGVVISDELFMDAIENNYGLDEAIVETINAGTDILLFSTNLYNGKSLPGFIISLVTEKVNDGTISNETIDEAYNRIMDLKDLRIITGNEDYEPIADLPKNISVSNYPNPFNPVTTISVTLEKSSEVSVRIANSVGQIVQNLEKSRWSAGTHTFRFDASNYASGVYFVMLDTDNNRQVHKMLLLK